MGISVSPSAFRSGSYQPYTPKVYSYEELQQLKKKPTEVVTEGDVYRSSATDFKKLTLDELQREKFTVDTSKREHTTYSDGSTDNTKQIIAIRDPMDNGKVMTLELSKKTIDNLKKKFGDANNFFERDDGVLRLNGKAENFVAGWMKDIRQNRNYDEADADKNGKIERNEAQALTIAFERQNDYEYIGEKLVKVNSGMGGDSYQSLGRSGDAGHLFETDDEKAKNKEMGYTYKRNITASQYTKFENTVEKELDHTLQMDADLNGVVTLDEGLRDEFGKDYRQKIIDTTQEFHEHLLRERPSLNDSSRLQYYDIGLHGIISEDEEKAQKEAFRTQGLYIQEQMKTKQIQDQFALNGMGTIDILDAKNAKASPLQNADPLALRSYALPSQSDIYDAKINAYG